MTTVCILIQIRTKTKKGFLPGSYYFLIRPNAVIDAAKQIKTKEPDKYLSQDQVVTDLTQTNTH